MALNLSSLAPFTTTASGLSGLVLVTPNQVVGYQPQNNGVKDGLIKQQPPTIVFHYEGENQINLESEITDHYIEDNTAIQDQIALRPEKISVHGFIGELNDVAPFPLQVAKTLAEKLTTVSAYTPELTTTALLAYNSAFQAYQTAQTTINAAVSAWSSLFGGTGGQTKQQIAFQQFYGYWKARTLFTVQTPWAIFQDCAIMNLNAVQDAETRMITDFAITFKMMRFATTQTVAQQSGQYQTRAANQAAGVTDLGTSTPPSDISLSTGLTQMGAQ